MASRRGRAGARDLAGGGARGSSGEGTRRHSRPPVSVPDRCRKPLDLPGRRHARLRRRGGRDRRVGSQRRDRRARRAAHGVSVGLPDAADKPTPAAGRDSRRLPGSGRAGGNRAGARRGSAARARDRRADTHRRGARHRARHQDAARIDPHAGAPHHTVGRGSLYLVEINEHGDRRLRFRLAQTYSKPEAPFVEHTIGVDRGSLAGYCAVTGDPLVIDDAYFLPPDVEYTINRSFDERYGYRTKSMLVIPMKDHKEEIIGVLQLINRKRNFDAILTTPADVERQVIPYSKRTVELVTALAGQAAVAIENGRLYEDIEKLFEGFVLAAVHAIEQRDPTTYGHSGRVAGMTVGLAEVVDRAGDGLYRGVSFSREQIKEIRYAALLHDFGKVGVREQVLVKAKKLYPSDLSLVRHRHAFIRRTAEREFWRKRAEYLEANGTTGYDRFVKELEAEHERELKELDRFLEIVLLANEPSILPDGSFDELKGWAQRTFLGLDGTTEPFLSPDDMRYLTIRKGSLDEAERHEIESHVSHTYQFLQRIPWTRELQQIPLIAYGHHEKMDGRGYPRRVAGEAIPIQTRMMTISDIYDALTAQDRPYKRAVSTDRALDILTTEVNEGQLDADLFKLFIEGKVFQRQIVEDGAS